MVKSNLQYDIGAISFNTFSSEIESKPSPNLGAVSSFHITPLRERPKEPKGAAYWLASAFTRATSHFSYFDAMKDLTIAISTPIELVSQQRRIKIISLQDAFKIATDMQSQTERHLQKKRALRTHFFMSNDMED